MVSRLFQVRTLALATLVVGMTGLVGSILLLFAALPIDMLDVSGNKYDTMDVPVYLLYAEGILYAILAVAASIVAATTVLGNADTAKSSMLALSIILAIVWVGHGGTSGWRGFHLYSTIDGSCGDISTRAACPTSRVGRSLHSAEHLGGDCTFWFWGAMQPRTDIVSAYPNEQLDVLELMDWSRHEPYGWSMEEGVPVYGGEKLLTFQQTFETTYNISVGTFKIDSTSVPNIAHCWYWGCHPVCNEERYFINQAMLWFVASWTAVEIILFGVGIYLARAPVDKDKFDSPAARVEEVPIRRVLGRRLRF